MRLGRARESMTTYFFISAVKKTRTMINSWVTEMDIKKLKKLDIKLKEWILYYSLFNPLILSHSFQEKKKPPSLGGKKKLALHRLYGLSTISHGHLSLHLYRTMCSSLHRTRYLVHAWRSVPSGWSPYPIFSQKTSPLACVLTAPART